MRFVCVLMAAFVVLLAALTSRGSMPSQSPPERSGIAAARLQAVPAGPGSPEQPAGPDTSTTTNVDEDDIHGDDFEDVDDTSSVYRLPAGVGISALGPHEARFAQHHVAPETPPPRT